MGPEREFRHMTDIEGVERNDAFPTPAEGIEVDLLVIGAGMAGLTAAAAAATRGAHVLVVEKAPVIGGTAALSGAYVWTFPMLADFDRLDPGGRLDLQTVILDEFGSAIDFIRSMHLQVSDPVAVLDGVGHQVDLAGYIDRCRSTVEANGGHIVVGAAVESLNVTEAGRVTGALVSDPSGRYVITASWTLLATGGFAGSADLLGTWLGARAAKMPVRASGLSTGDGLSLAVAAGGASTGHNRGFYGHLVPSGVRLDDKERLRDLSMYHSDHGVLLTQDGRRYTDESDGDHYNAAATLWRAESKALLVWDERVNREVVLQPFPKGSAGSDRLANALAAGGAGGCVAGLHALVSLATSLGFDGDGVVATIAHFNDGLKHDSDLIPLRARHRRPIAEPPFYAVSVEPAITSTYGGIRVDAAARVLGRDGAPVDGLLAAGIDGGDTFRWGYGGGLALAATTALRAVSTTGIGAPR